MKRLICLFLAIVSVAVTLCGCHGSSERAVFSVPAEFDENSSYEITFWAKNDTNVTQKKIYEKSISDFEKLYPNIKVNLRLYTDYGRIYNDVITNISTGTTPNICITYPDHIATYLTGANTVVPLDELIIDENYGLGGSALKYESPALGLVEKFADECILGEKRYAVPFMRSTEACYINKTLVEKLGYSVPDVLTWDYIWEVSDAAAKKSADGTYLVNGQKVMIPFIYKSTDNMMIQMLRQKNAGYSNAAGQIQLFNDVTKELLYTVGEHVESGAFSTFKISSYPGNFLNAGQCVFAVDSTAGATWIGTNAPLSDIAEDQVVEFETEVRMIPQFDPDNPQMISQGPSICIFNKDDPQEVLASWLFCQYLLTNEVQIAYSKTEGYLPVTRDALESEEYNDYISKIGIDNNEHYDVKIKASKLIRDNIDNTFVTPVFNGSASLRDASGQLIENVAKSVRRKETVDESYMEKLFDDVTSLYRLNQGSASGRADLGPMPKMSVILLSSIGLAWIIIVAYLIRERLKKRKKL